MSVYHHRVRRGMRVCWAEREDGTLVRLAPIRPWTSDEEIAVEVLADALDGDMERVWPLHQRAAHWIEGMGPYWDLTSGTVRAWASAQDGGPL